jgi:hypothetical protein
MPLAIQSAPSAAQAVGAIPVLPAALVAVARPAAAATEPYGEGVSLPHAFGKGPPQNVPSAAAKDEKPGSRTWTEKLAAMFDGGAKKAADETPLDPAGLKAFIVRHGRPMTEITLAEAAAHGGQVRLLTAKNDPSGLTQKHAAQIGAIVTGRVQQEQIAVDWAPKAAAAAQTAETKTSSTFFSKLLWPVREA